MDIVIYIRAAKNLRPTFNSAIPSDLKKLIESMWSSEVETFPSIQEILKTLCSMEAEFLSKKESINKNDI